MYKTLKRDVWVRDFLEDDIKYLWAAEDPKLREEVHPQTYHDNMKVKLVTDYHEAWIMEAPNKGKRKPVGVVFGVQCGPLTMIGDTLWFPWATKRNKIEGFIKLLVIMGKRFLLTGYCSESDKPFFVHAARHGVIRRVGTLNGIYDEPSAFWQTRITNGRNSQLSGEGSRAST